MITIIKIRTLSTFRLTSSLVYKHNKANCFDTNDKILAHLQNGMNMCDFKKIDIFK